MGRGEALHDENAYFDYRNYPNKVKKEFISSTGGSRDMQRKIATSVDGLAETVNTPRNDI
jgi:hypothetical protein